MVEGVRWTLCTALSILRPLLLRYGVLVRLDHIARFIVNANHSIVRAAAKLCVADCITDRIWLAIPAQTEWPRNSAFLDCPATTGSFEQPHIKRGASGTHRA